MVKKQHYSLCSIRGRHRNNRAVLQKCLTIRAHICRKCNNYICENRGWSQNNAFADYVGLPFCSIASNAHIAFSKKHVFYILNLRRRAKQRVLEFRARCKCCIASVSAGARLCAIVYLLVFPHHHPPPTTHHPPPRTIMHQPPYNKPTPPPRPPPTPHVHSGSNQGSRRPPTPSAVRRQGEGGGVLAGRTAGAERHRQRPRQHQHQRQHAVVVALAVAVTTAITVAITITIDRTDTHTHTRTDRASGSSAMPRGRRRQRYFKTYLTWKRYTRLVLQAWWRAAMALLALALRRRLRQ